MTIAMGGMELVVEPPIIPTFEAEAPSTPDLVILPVPGVPGRDGEDGAPGVTNYDHIPSLSLIFENGLA